MRKDSKYKNDKYVVNIVFTKDKEDRIRARAKDLELPIATYIKQLIRKDIQENS